jgi:hypothetical protein
LFSNTTAYTWDWYCHLVGDKASLQSNFSKQAQTLTVTAGIGKGERRCLSAILENWGHIHGNSFSL